MRLITRDDFLTSLPCHYGQIPAEYLNVSTLYRKLLNEYARDQGLGTYDEALAASEFDFPVIKDDDQDFSQFYNNAGLHYYYVRNNVYLDRLGEADYRYLKDKFDWQDFDLHDEDALFIASSFQNVICEKHEGMDGDFKTNFGPTSSAYFALNRTLVIGFRYDEWNNVNNLSDDDFGDLLEMRDLQVCQVHEAAQKRLETMLNCPVKIIEYNQFSIKDRVWPREVLSW